MGLQEAFWEDWHWATGEVITLDWQPQETFASNHHVVVVPSGPADRQDTASLLIQQVIQSAEERLWVTSPYFVPDQGVQDALRLAAMRGVDVRVMIPERPDHLLVFLSAFSFLPDMLRAGVKIYRYLPGFLHQKVMLVDNKAATVGTVNMDNRSFRLNFEITAFMPSAAVAAQVRVMLEKTLRSADVSGWTKLLNAPGGKSRLARRLFNRPDSVAQRLGVRLI